MCAAVLLAGDRGTLCAPGGAITGITGPVIRRITSLLWSAIRSPPGGVIATNSGSKSSAALAGRPSPEYPGVPVPTIVVIVPDGETLLMTLLPLSEIR